MSEKDLKVVRFYSLTKLGERAAELLGMAKRLLPDETDTVYELVARDPHKGELDAAENNEQQYQPSSE